MKIAHVARWLEVGGTEQVIYDLCRLGGETQWVVGMQDGPMRHVFEKAGIDVRLGTSHESLTRQLSQADVVVLHWLECQPAMVEAARAARKPMACVLHGLTTMPHFEGLVLCTSKRVFEQQEHNRERLVLILNAVDTALFNPPKQRPTDRIRIIRVCRPVRCAEYFWPAVCQVLEVCPNAEVTVVGGSPYRVGRVECLGNRHDVAQLLASAHIFAYAPYPHEGTLDLVVLEAMATGLACVAADVPCVNESIRHGVTGLLSPFGDTNAFADNLIKVVRDPALRERLGKAAAVDARERFDMRQRVRAYEAAYRRAYAEQSHATNGRTNGRLLTGTAAYA